MKIAQTSVKDENDDVGRRIRAKCCLPVKKKPKQCCRESRAAAFVEHNFVKLCTTRKNETCCSFRVCLINPGGSRVVQDSVLPMIPAADPHEIAWLQEIPANTGERIRLNPSCSFASNRA